MVRKSTTCFYEDELEHHIFSVIPYNMFWKDKKGTFQGCNNAFKKSLKIKTDIKGFKDTELGINKKQLKNNREREQEVIRSGKPILNQEEIYKLYDGRTTIIKINRFPIKNEQGHITGIVGLFVDITEQKEAEKHYQRLFSNMLNGFAYHKIMYDTQGKPIDYTFIEVNDAFEKMTGLKRKHIIGKRVSTIIPGIKKDPANWIERYGKIAQGGKAESFEQYAEGIGKKFMVSVYSPEPDYFVTIIEDISDRQRAQDILIKNNQELERFNKFAIDREIKMVELKKKIKELEKQVKKK